MDVFYCTENGGTIEIRTNEDGTRSRACVFSDGSECEPWAYYEGKCQPDDNPADHIGMPDPAAVHCTETGGTYETRTDENGGQYGVCLFGDGSECDAWVYFLGECQASDKPLDRPQIVPPLDGGKPGDPTGLPNPSDRPQIMPPLEGGKPARPIGMANPASVYCAENGGNSEIRTDENGGQYGVCVFSDGSECDEWAFYRGECQPSDVPGINAPGMMPPIMMPPRMMPALYYDGNRTSDPSILPMGGDTAVMTLANPAATYCKEHDGKYEIKTDEDGSQSGVCVYSDGREVSDYTFFKGEDGPQL